jgi:hypothetical protein
MIRFLSISSELPGCARLDSQGRLSPHWLS